MRLRKNMKRTAAAVLALSMAVSAAAAPASAAYICDVSKGNVEISRDGSYTSITVGGKKVNDNGDGTNDIIITGDNTKPTATESLNAAEENTSEVEKSGETKTEGEGKTQNSAAENKEQAEEPGSLELLAPEDEQKKDEEKKDEQKPAETQETEQDKKTEKTSDQVIEYGQYDAEAQQEATKPAVKQEAEEKKAAEEKTYGDTNAPTTLSEKAQAAANNVVSIINNSASALKVILKNLKVDAGNTNKSAVTVSGKGGVTLELDGKNELTGGSGTVQNEYYGTRARAGLKSEMGKTTITDSDGNGTLISTGGTIVVDDSYANASSGAVAGFGIDGAVIAGGTVVAKGGDVVFESKINKEQPYFTAGSGILTPEISGGIVEATGGSAIGDGTLGSLLEAGHGVGGDDFVVAVSGIKTAITGGTVKATGGNGRYVGGYGLRLPSMSISGGTVIAQGGTGQTGGCGVQDVTVSGGSLVAVGGAGSKTGGDGFNEYGTVKVTGGSVTAQGGKGKEKDGAAVGSEENVTGTVTKVDSTHVHQYADSDVVKEATCTSEGYKLKKCSKCGAEEMERIGKKDHTWVQSKHQDATCVEGGYTEYKCSACGETKRDEISATGKHHFTVVKEVVAPTYTSEGYTIYKCETCDETEKRDVVPMLVPESNGASSGGSSAVTLTVTGAGAYETSIADGRYTVAVPAETAVLSGCLSNLKELKAQGVNTLVFRTQLRETALNIDSMLSLGVDGTLFALTHSGESAELTVGGVAHNELLH